MDTERMAWERLTLLLERVLDAETLTTAQSALLLQASQAARLAWAQGEVQAAQRHLERLARHIHTLLASKRLALADAQALLRITHRLLSPQKHAGEGRSESASPRHDLCEDTTDPNRRNP